MVLPITEVRLTEVCLRILFVTSVAVCLVTGCGWGGLRVVGFSDLPVRTATPKDLIAEVNRNAVSLGGVKGYLEMGLMKGPGEKVRRCSGMLVAVNPPRGGLYLKGYRRLNPTYFILVSDGDEFWFHIPRDNVVYTGPLDFVWSRDDSLPLYLNARDLFRALFIAPIKADATWDVLETEGFYVITVYKNDRVTRKIRIERKGFNIVDEIYYDAQSLAQLEIQRKDFADLDGRRYPASLVLHDLISGSSVFLDFSEITLDPENVPDEAFRFRIPDDVDVRSIEPNKAQP